MTTPASTRPETRPDLRSRAGTRQALERLRRRYHHRRFVHPDPLEFVHEFSTAGDREVVGLLAAALAYGNVTAMLPAIRRVLDRLGPEPARVASETTAAVLKRSLRGFRYRFTHGAQVAALLTAAGRVRKAHGSLDACIEGSADGVEAIGALVDALRAAAPREVGHLLAHPRDRSACKRLSLYFRWMVRCDTIDPGGWRSLTPAQLLVPLDTHVFQAATRHGWTTRRTPGLATAIDVTRALAAIRPDDPLRYDFALTRPGIRNE